MVMDYLPNAGLSGGYAVGGQMRGVNGPCLSQKLIAVRKSRYVVDNSLFLSLADSLCTFVKIKMHQR